MSDDARGGNMHDPTFANMTWQPRWNGAEAVASLSQSGADVMATGFFGVLRFQLDDDESVAAIVRHARAFADMVEAAKREYDTALADVDALIERYRQEGGKPT